MTKQLVKPALAILLSTASLWAQDAADLFGKLDANKDGYITPDEVQESQKALYERLLRTADKDGDKKLSKDEFQAGLKPDDSPRQPLAGGGFGGPPGGKGDPREFFNRMDANKDGKLTKDELPERLQENFARLDANGDGSISPEELARGGQAFGKRPPGAPGTPQAGTTPPGGRPGLNMGDRRQIEELFDRTDSNSDGKLTKDEVPEERRGMRIVLEQSGGDSLTKDQFVRGMLAMMQNQPRPEGAPRPDGAPRPEGAPRADGAPQPRPDMPPGGPGGSRGLQPGLFAILDADRNGELSTAEIAAAGAALLKLDKNGDGKLTPDEVFSAPPGGGFGGPGMRGRPGEGRPEGAPPANGAAGAPNAERRPGQRGLGALNPEELRQRLKEADTNSDGKISKDEAPALLKERFDRIDTNSDGFIDESEVRQMVRRLAEEGGKGKARPNNDNK